MIIKGQIIASTSVDAHGERFSKSELEKFVAGLPQKLSLNAMHDLSQPISGTATNLRLLPIKNGMDWNLVADIETNDPRFGDQFKGMSISITSPLFELPKSEFSLALPYPNYKDESLVKSLIATNTISIAMWRRKALSSEQTAALVAFLTIVLKPMWEDIYQNAFKPGLKVALSSVFPVLAHHDIALEFIQHIEFQGRLVEIRVLQVEQLGSDLVDDENLLQILKAAHSLLLAQSTGTSPITRIVFRYDKIGRAFYASRIDYLDASSTSY